MTYSTPPITGDNILLKGPENPNGDSLDVAFAGIKRATKEVLGPKGKILGTGDLTAGGRAMKWISVSSEKADGKSVTQKVFVARHNNRILLVICSAATDRWDIRERGFDDALKSIRFE